MESCVVFTCCSKWNYTSGQTQTQRNWRREKEMTLPHTLSLERRKTYSTIHTTNQSSFNLPDWGFGSLLVCFASLAPAPLVQTCQSLVVCLLHSIDDRPRGLVDAVFVLCRRWPLVLSMSSRLDLNSVSPRNSPPQMSSFLSLRSAHCALSFVT